MKAKRDQYGEYTSSPLSQKTHLAKSCFTQSVTLNHGTLVDGIKLPKTDFPLPVSIVLNCSTSEKRHFNQIWTDLGEEKCILKCRKMDFLYCHKLH